MGRNDAIRVSTTVTSNNPAMQLRKLTAIYVLTLCLAGPLAAVLTGDFRREVSFFVSLRHCGSSRLFLKGK